MPGILNWKITIDLGCKGASWRTFIFSRWPWTFHGKFPPISSRHEMTAPNRGGKAEEERQRRRLKSCWALFVFNQRLEVSKFLDNLLRFFGGVGVGCMYVLPKQKPSKQNHSCFIFCSMKMINTCFFRGGGFKYVFHPWGNDPVWLAHIYQMGWKQPPSFRNPDWFSSRFCLSKSGLAEALSSAFVPIH